MQTNIMHELLHGYSTAILQACLSAGLHCHSLSRLASMQLLRPSMQAGLVRQGLLCWHQSQQAPCSWLQLCVPAYDLLKASGFADSQARSPSSIYLLKVWTIFSQCSWKQGSEEKDHPCSDVPCKQRLGFSQLHMHVLVSRGSVFFTLNTISIKLELVPVYYSHWNQLWKSFPLFIGNSASIDITLIRTMFFTSCQFHGTVEVPA